MIESLTLEMETIRRRDAVTCKAEMVQLPATFSLTEPRGSARALLATSAVTESKLSDSSKPPLVQLENEDFKNGRQLIETWG